MSTSWPYTPTLTLEMDYSVLSMSWAWQCPCMWFWCLHHHTMSSLHQITWLFLGSHWPTMKFHYDLFLPTSCRSVIFTQMLYGSSTTGNVGCDQLQDNNCFASAWSQLRLPTTSLELIYGGILLLELSTHLFSICKLHASTLYVSFQGIQQVCISVSKLSFC